MFCSFIIALRYFFCRYRYSNYRTDIYKGSDDMMDVIEYIGA